MASTQDDVTWEDRKDGPPLGASIKKWRFNDYAPPNRRPDSSIERYYSNDPIVELEVNKWANRHQRLLCPDPEEPPVRIVSTSMFSYSVGKLVAAAQPQSGSSFEDEADSEETKSDLWWRYAALGCFIYRQSIPDKGEGDDGEIGRLPVQPRDKERRRRQLCRPHFAPTRRLWLFNVIVAFECWPLDKEVERQIRWLSRTASDFLYDVTNGYMAISQIVLGGRELMPYADIQVFASNRLFPRSWVSGMYNREKYAPIRVGSGLWNKNRRINIPWDEPEAYRTLVHEWAHYALGLRDHYVQKKDVVLEAGSSASPIQSLVPQDKQVFTCTLTVPSVSLPVESIMSNLEGTSELTMRSKFEGPGVPRVRPDFDLSSSKEEKEADWDIVERNFPWLTQEPYPARSRIDPGPDRLPIPLPEILLTDSVEENYKSVRLLMPLWREDEGDEKGKPIGPREQPRQPPSNSALLLPIWDIDKNSALEGQPAPYIIRDHCWVYLLKRRDAAAQQDNGQNRDYERLIAQGTLEDRRGDEGFALVGAQEHDIVMLIGRGFHERPDGIGPIPEPEPIVLTTKLENLELATEPRQWDDATPEVFPFVDVYPSDKYRPDNNRYHVEVAVSEPGWQAWVFPLGASNDEETVRAVSWNGASLSIPPKRSSEIEVPSLDGHVLLRKDEGGSPRYTIATYSIGGTPSSAWPAPPNPLAAGSSEGNAMLFFFEDGKTAKEQYHDQLVVTTLNHGILPPVDQTDPFPVRYEPRGYTFSVAANTSLLTGKLATLVLFYDRDTLDKSGQLHILRYIPPHDQEERSTWQEIPSFSLPALSYIAAPLYGKDEQRFKPVPFDEPGPALPSDTAEGQPEPPRDTAGGLFADPLSAERYRLFLKLPRQS